MFFRLSAVKIFQKMPILLSVESFFRLSTKRKAEV